MSLNHFPQITYKGEEKYLWNPILKKAFKNLPEERVRLKIVEYLTLEAGFSKNRISFETPVNLPRDKSRSRTDVICYDGEFKPLLLIECKSPEVRLNAKVALQIARYNQQVEAELLLVSNGKTDFWFSQHVDTLKFLDEAPEPFQSNNQPEQKFDYWTKRGFAGKNSDPEIRTWIMESCVMLYNSKDSYPQFFGFEGTSPELGLANYYRIYEISKNINLALSLTSTPFGATKVNAVLNDHGENVALISISLDLLASEEQKNTILQSSNGIEHLDLKEEIGFTLTQPLNFYTKALSDLML